MAIAIRRVDYFYTTVSQEPSEACELLAALAGLGVNLLALNVVPQGPASTQLTLFPEDAARLVNAARQAGLTLSDRQRALLVQGNDELGALARIHARLHEEHVSIYSTSGVTDGHGFYGYLIYVSPDDFDRAASLLEV